MKPEDLKAAWLRYCEAAFPDDAVAAEELANDEGCRGLFAAGAEWRQGECVRLARDVRDGLAREQEGRLGYPAAGASAVLYALEAGKRG